MTSMSNINTNRVDHHYKDTIGRKGRGKDERLQLPIINSHNRDRSNDAKNTNHKKSTIVTHKLSLKSKFEPNTEGTVLSLEKTPIKKPFKPGLGMLLEGKRLAI